MPRCPTPEQREGHSQSICHLPDGNSSSSRQHLLRGHTQCIDVELTATTEQSSHLAACMRRRSVPAVQQLFLMLSRPGHARPQHAHHDVTARQLHPSPCPHAVPWHLQRWWCTTAVPRAATTAVTEDQEARVRDAEAAVAPGLDVALSDQDAQIQPRTHAIEPSPVIQASSDLQLRDYQEDAISAILAGYQQGKSRVLVAMATGAGKTFTFGWLAHCLPHKTLILVHRKELLDQAVKSLLRVGISDKDVGVVYRRKREVHRRVVVATVQSAYQDATLELLKQANFQFCIVDEAHHIAADTWMKSLFHLGFVDEEIVNEVKRRRDEQRGSSGSPVRSTSASETDEATTSGSPSPSPQAARASSPQAVRDGSAFDPDAGAYQHAVAPSTSQDAGPTATTDASPAPTDDAASTGSGETQDEAAAREAGDVVTVDLLAEVEFAGERYSWPLSRKLVLGVTATPFRKDNKRALPAVFEEQVYTVDIAKLIAEGTLCKVLGYRVNTYTDISKAKAKTAAKEDGVMDFSDRELSKIINTPERNKLVVDTFKELADLSADAASPRWRSAIAFCCDVDQGQQLAAMFREHDVTAACIHGGLDLAARAELLRKHKSGEITVLTNVGILTEGYDDPGVSCVLMTRPTKSTGLYTQCVGRGLRQFPGKVDCLVIDFTDRTHRLDKQSDLVTLESISEGSENIHLVGYRPPPPPKVEPQIKLLMQGGELSLYGSDLSWLPLGDSLYLQMSNWMDNPAKKRSPYPYNHNWTQPDKASFVPQAVWVQLKKSTDVTSRGRQVYTLRVHAGKTMPAEDSEAWYEMEVKGPSKAAQQAGLSTRPLRQLDAARDGLSKGKSMAQESTSDLFPESTESLELPPESVLLDAEKLLKKLARERLLGVTPSMIKGVDNTRKDWYHHRASTWQLKTLMDNNSKWRLFAESEPVPDDLLKGEASALISLGKLYEAYCAANPDRVPAGSSASPQEESN